MSLQTDSVPIICEIKKPKKVSSSNEVNQEEVITLEKSLGTPNAISTIERFTERQHFLQEPLEYPRKGSEPGLVLIFNQESFEDQNLRLGSRRDVNEIILCMSRLGYNIEEKNILTDSTREQILSKIDDILSQDLSEVNALILFFLSHGDEFNMLHTKHISIKANEIWEKFNTGDNNNKPKLFGKPKLFIFQACKGGKSTTIADQTTKRTIDLVPENTFQSNFIQPDNLILYSTAEGNVSVRDPKNGTWFIQELCKNFLAYGRRDDVVSLMMRTSKCLARNYFFHKENVITKQMPVFISTLRKKFYLNRTKDRNLLLKLLQDQEEMKQKMKVVEEIIKNMVLEKEKKNNK